MSSCRLEGPWKEDVVLEEEGGWGAVEADESERLNPGFRMQVIGRRGVLKFQKVVDLIG